MRGRSKITFDNKTKRLLQGIEEDEANADLVSRAIWFRTAASCHTKLVNRIINLARTMKPCNNAAAEMDRQKVTGNTAKAMWTLPSEAAPKPTLLRTRKVHKGELERKMPKDKKRQSHWRMQGTKLGTDIRRIPAVWQANA